MIPPGEEGGCKIAATVEQGPVEDLPGSSRPCPWQAAVEQGAVGGVAHRFGAVAADRPDFARKAALDPGDGGVVGVAVELDGGEAEVVGEIGD